MNLGFSDLSIQVLRLICIPNTLYPTIPPDVRVIFALQSKSNDEVAGLGGAKKIGYHPVLGERSGRKMVQRAMSLAQTK